VIALNGKNVENRLKDYLERDGQGVRRAVLELFLEKHLFTTEEVYQHLRDGGYDVSYRGVSAMVGLMNTRLGIFRIDVTKNHNVYSLKDSYKDVVRSLLSEENGLVSLTENIVS
jgi:arginine repressor